MQLRATVADQKINHGRVRFICQLHLQRDRNLAYKLELKVANSDDSE